MYSELYDVLEMAQLAESDDDAKLEVVTKSGDTFTGISNCPDDGDDHLGWDFAEVEGVSYSFLYLKDIARVRRVGDTEWAWEHDKAKATV